MSQKPVPYPWPHPTPITCPGESLRVALATDARDWSLDRRDAWLWGIINGWPDCDAMREVAKRHGWDHVTVERLRTLHRKFNAAFPQPWRKGRSRLTLQEALQEAEALSWESADSLHVIKPRKVKDLLEKIYSQWEPDGQYG